MGSAKGKKRRRAKTLPRRSGRRGRPKAAPMATTADRHELYELAVQDPENEVEFLREVYRRVRRRLPRRLREDFCGTATVCAQWVRRGPKNTAEGFDLDVETLEWGRRHHLDALGGSARRVMLHPKDVRQPGLHRADITCAHNFSYQVFQTRKEMLEYLESVHRHLADDGVFVLDMYGGWEATEELTEEREIEGTDGVLYVWEQISYAPVTGRQRCAIHFRFPDGSELRNAFQYDWRHWTMPEMRDLLKEAGFLRVDAWFEEIDEDGDGTGVFAPTDTGINCEGWLGYLVAYK